MNLTLITHLAVALATAACVWVFQDARMDAAVADVRLEQSNERLGAVTQARADDNETADKDAAHAASTQGNSDAFTQSQPARDASRRADIDRLARVQLDAERREATYRAQAQADAAARSGLADQLAAFDRQLVEGVRVVGELRADLERRDAEVVLLHRQVMTERAVNAE